MRKLGLYAGIIIIVFFLSSCTKQENELIQDNMETEETAERLQDHAGIKEDTKTCRLRRGKMDL